MRRMLAAFLATSFALGADEPPTKGYVCTRATSPIVLDGKLDDPSWAEAPWTDEFVDILGAGAPRPRFRTRAKMLWDDTYFYIAGELMEPHVSGTLTKHDSVIFHDNDFEIFIDPDGDNHEYCEIEINALNTEWDLLLEKPYRAGGPAVDAWEIPGLKTATHVDGKLNDPAGVDESWSVEVAIPWKVLGERAHRPSPPRDGDQWRVNFSRVEWEYAVEGGAYKKVPNKPEDNWVWSPQGVVDMHRPERWGYVQFSTQPAGKAPFRPDPAEPAKGLLMRLFQKQVDYRGKTKTWATSLGQLGQADDPPRSDGLIPALRMTPEGFEIDVTTPPKGEVPPQTWTVRQDSRLAKKP